MGWNEWEYVKLRDVCTGNGSYGIAASAVPYSDKLPAYLRITDVNDDGTINLDGLKSVDDPSASRYFLAPNDIVFARTGASTGRNYFYDGSDGSFVFAGFLIRFSIDPCKINPVFVKYYCKTEKFNEWVRSFNTGSTRGNINAQTYGNMPIPKPPRAQQDLIADTLSAFDKKIAVNRKLNHNLEQAAQAIYTELCLDGEVAKLSDILAVCYGKDHKRLPDGNVPCYGSGGIMRYVDTAIYNNESVLIPRKGSLNNVLYINESFWTVDTMFYTHMTRPNVAKFVYFTARNLDLAGMNVGSAVPSMTTAVLNVLEIVLPSNDKLAKFEEIVSPMFLQMQTNSAEAAQLAIMRDTLLPELMSGELSVADLT